MCWMNPQPGRPGRVHVPGSSSKLPGLQTPRSTNYIAPGRIGEPETIRLCRWLAPTCSTRAHQSCQVPMPALATGLMMIFARVSVLCCCACWSDETQHLRKLAAESPCLHCCVPAHSSLVVSATSLNNLARALDLFPQQAILSSPSTNTSSSSHKCYILALGTQQVALRTVSKQELS